MRFVNGLNLQHVASCGCNAADKELPPLEWLPLSRTDAATNMHPDLRSLNSQKRILLKSIQYTCWRSVL
jgi:hypothetical protein